MTTEKDLRLHIIKWLADQGLEVAHECWSMNNCDVVGFEFYPQTSRRIPKLARVFAIELKIRDFQGVLMQCRNHRRYANQVYAAMPKVIVDKIKLETCYKFMEQGIGLLSVADNGIVEIRESSLNYAPYFNRNKKALWRWHKKNQKALFER
ncbi:MAG: hypothetical protein M0R34_00385 [Candidatus Marinimicrobia bacterium]|nr:hypothetical protein [Candidatus Neomarinimicrobiota bacterium]